jgi:plasmid stabilization system protein ParE
MANRSVRFHEQASRDLEEAFDWYFVRSEWAAARFLQAVDNGIESVVESPKRWPMDDSGLRRYLLETFALFYRESSACIEIIAVAHTSRRPGFWKGRL